MEEKERYELTDTDCIFDTERDIVVSDVCDVVANADIITNLLNQQDKRTKELEEENKELEIKLDKCGTELVNAESLVSYLENENQQLKQQLHELPKKIVNEIKEQLFNHFKVKDIEEYEKLPLIDSLFTADTMVEILQTILKKYGVE